MATGVEQTATTNESGIYNFPYVAPGQYDVTVAYEGFKTATQSNVTIETGCTRTVNVSLEVGPDRRSGDGRRHDAPLLESETSSVGQFIERERVQYAGTEPAQLASQADGNVSFRSEDGGEQVRSSLDGRRPRSQNQMWTLDGSVVQNMSIGVQQLALNPPAESLQEFKAEMNNYSAEYGRAGGGFILMTTRSGNQRPPAAYEFFRNNAMDARPFFATETSHCYTTSSARPSADRSSKSFFFFNYEGGPPPQRHLLV
ncbi:MAG: carboxypeptidase-like regulatory domain-containing protein [Bryobacterales bacterium]